MNESTHLIPLWQKAAHMAAHFHRHQKRKQGDIPYVTHPFRVALTVRDIFEENDSVTLAAALTHDLIEDTTADYDDIRMELGTEVADLVAALTKDMRMRSELREQSYDDQLSEASWKAKLIKLADVYDNYCDCPDDAMRSTAREKGKRILAIVDGDPRLTTAGAKLRALIG